MEDREPSFTLLSHEEFGRLSREEKVSYLTRAVEAMRRGVPVAAMRPPSDDETDC